MVGNDCLSIIVCHRFFVCSQRRGNRNKKMAEHHTPNILSCNEERHFWLSWYSGHICLGHGRKKGENMIVSYQDLNPSPILAISFSSFQVAGGWRIPLQSGMLIQMHSTDHSSLYGTRAVGPPLAILNERCVQVM